MWQWSRRNRGSVDGGSGGIASLSCWGGERLLERSACWPKCGSMEVWQSPSGNDAWFLPSTEEVTESRDCMEPGIAGGGGSIGDGVGDGIKAVDNCVGWYDGRHGKVVVMEVDCVRDAEGLGYGIDDLMAVVMLEGDANIKFIRAAEVQGAAGGWLVVDEFGAAEWQERGGIVVEEAIEVCLGWHAWCDGGLVEEVEC
jgi:hypothetical protein